MPHASAVGRFSLAVRPDRPVDASECARQAGPGDRARRPEVAAHEGLDADGAQDDHDDRDEDQRRPVELAREREVVGGPAEPGEVGEWGEARDGALVAIQEEPAEGDRAGDAGRRSAAEERAPTRTPRDPAASARRPSQIA